MVNSNGRTRLEAIQEMSASTGAFVFALACILNAGLLVYVTLGQIN